MFIYFELSDIIHRASDMQSLQDDMDNLLQWEHDWQINSISASVSFYVSPTNVSHLPEITIYMDTN